MNGTAQVLSTPTPPLTTRSDISRGGLMPTLPDPKKSGAKNPHWRGGRIVDRYIKVLRRDHPMASANGYVYEHRIVVAEAMGRVLLSSEHVHHINGNTHDNRIENLMIVDVFTHRVLHRTSGTNKRLPGEPNPLIQCACGCGGWIPTYDRFNVPHQFIHGHNKGHQRNTWDPCVRCGDPDGYIPKRQTSPARKDGGTFGIEGEVCSRCYSALYRQERRAHS